MKIGDKFKIKYNVSNHYFEIGEVITLVSFKEDNLKYGKIWKAVNSKNKSYNISELDLEKM